MDNAQKAIMIGVGLFITIIIIAAVMAITGMGQSILNQGSTQVGNLSAQLQQQLTADYDNVSLTGADVVNAIQKYYNDKNIVVYLVNKSGGSIDDTDTSLCTSAKKLTGTISFSADDSHATTAALTTVKNGDQPSMGELNDSTNTNHYVNPRASYKSQLIKTNDDVVVGIVLYKVS